MARARAASLIALMLCTTGCATMTPVAPTWPPLPAGYATTTVSLHGTALELHTAKPAGPVTSRPLVIYASGDGGWYGAAVDMFRVIAAHGYPTVGFSARAFQRIERPRHAALDPRQLASDYATILAQCRRALGLPPSAPAILTGWSRGAAFAAIAASEPLLRGQVQGVVAIGLAADEGLRVGDETDEGPSAQASPPGDLRPYERLLTLDPVPCAVIQATHDDYLAAERGRALFGPDTGTRRFFTVPARNHRFAGGHEAFVEALSEALSWIEQSRSAMAW